MKVITTVLSLSLAAMNVLPAAADLSSSDRASWIEQSLNGGVNAKKSAGDSTGVGSKSAAASNSLTASSGSSLSRSVAGLFPGVKMRPFVPNRYLPSERDIEVAQAQAAQATQAAAPATDAVMPQQQLRANVSCAGGYSNNAAAFSRGQLLAASQQSATDTVAAVPQQTMKRVVSSAVQRNRVNALVPAILEPASGNETVEQIRSVLRSNAGSNKLIAEALPGNTAYGANLYPDITGPVPTQATAAARNTLSPLSFFSQKSTRQCTAAGAAATAATTGHAAANLPSVNFGSWRTRPGAASAGTTVSAVSLPAQRPGLSYGGFQSYSGKLHVQGPSVQRSNAASGQTQTGHTAVYTSCLPADCNIASADSYSVSGSPRIASYAPYATTQPSPLPY